MPLGGVALPPLPDDDPLPQPPTRNTAVRRVVILKRRRFFIGREENSQQLSLPMAGRWLPAIKWFFTCGLPSDDEPEAALLWHR